MELKKFRNLSIIFSIILGTLLHYTYEWSGNNFIVGLFSATNESTWEHLKLVFYPTLITAIVGNSLFEKKHPNFFCSKLIGIITSMLFVVSFFYTYTGIIGTNFDFLNILTFIVSIILGDFISYSLIINDKKFNKKICIIIAMILLFCFVFFTNNPPRINLFKGPLGGLFLIMKD